MLCMALPRQRCGNLRKVSDATHLVIVVPDVHVAIVQIRQQPAGSAERSALLVTTAPAAPARLIAGSTAVLCTHQGSVG